MYDALSFLELTQFLGGGEGVKGGKCFFISVKLRQKN